MIHPSYTELIEKINAGVEPGEEPVVQSRYSVVIAAAKRARQIIAGEEALCQNPDIVEKPLSQAVAELDEGEIHILSDEEFEAAQAELDAKKAALEAEREQTLEISEEEEDAEAETTESEEQDTEEVEETEETNTQEE
jgi:DNA-directed RNA polymerase subunit omega